LHFAFLFLHLVAAKGRNQGLCGKSVSQPAKMAQKNGNRNLKKSRQKNLTY